MIAKLINIGRRKINKEIEVSEDNYEAISQATTECCRFLMSRDVELIPTDDKKVFTVGAGFHTFGRVEFNRDINL